MGKINLIIRSKNELKKCAKYENVPSRFESLNNL